MKKGMEARKVTFEGGREEWLANRDKGIGASEVSAVLGLNPFQTPYQLWRRKRGMDGPTPENNAMRMGHFLEDAVAKLFADEAGVDIVPGTEVDYMYIATEKPHLRVSPDREYTYPDGERCILECKTTQRAVDPDNVPRHWFCQLQMNLGLSGLERGAIAWLTQGRDFGYREFAFSPEVFGMIADAVDRFWTDNVMGGVEPEAVNGADILAKFDRHAEGKEAVATVETSEDCTRIKEVKAEIASLEEELHTLEDRVKVRMADAERLVADNGFTLATWRSSKPSVRFDAKAFKAERPELAGRYMREAKPVRTFKVL